MTEELSKARNTSKEWAAFYRKREEEHIKTSSELIILEYEAVGLRERNERQAERLRFFRGMGCPPPIEELEVDPE